MAKLKLTLSLQRAVMSPIAGLASSNCANAQSGVIEYQRCLTQFGISPYEFVFHQQSFQKIAARALKLPRISVDPCGEATCSCHQARGTDLRAKLIKKIQDWKESEVHFCLDCFNGLRAANCRVCLRGGL